MTMAKPELTYCRHCFGTGHVIKAVYGKGEVGYIVTCSKCFQSVLGRETHWRKSKQEAIDDWNRREYAPNIIMW